MRVILHGMADDIGRLDKLAVIILMQGPENPPLNRLQSVSQVGDRAVADHIRGVFEETAVHPRPQPAEAVPAA
ncbi:MAG: hypothetical protein M2R45_05099 [Verrucomicrobia subdivision 3 bacterium]|nr:hypothetical protein [Limisphaerales bacterium]MCS1417768.1 hypothetical protein [Limisphaerales bacterium]